MGNIAGIAIVWFIIEMLLWYLIAQFVSGWWVFLWFIVAAVIGGVLVKTAFRTLKPLASQGQAAMFNPALRPNENSLIKAAAMAIAGFLFMLPGILTDIVALIVMLPAVQNKFKNFAKDYATKNPEKIMQMVASKMGGLDPSKMGGMMGGMGGQNPFGNMGGQNPFGGNNPFGGFGNMNNPMQKPKFGTTVDGQAKTVNPKTKKITYSANDE